MPKKSCRNEELERLRLRYAGRGKEGKTRVGEKLFSERMCRHFREDAERRQSDGQRHTDRDDRQQRCGTELRDQVEPQAIGQPETNSFSV